MTRIRQLYAPVSCLLAGAAILAILLAPARAQIKDEPRLEAVRSLVVMIDGSFSQGAGVVFAVDKGYVYIATMLHVVRRRASDSDDGLAKNLKVRFHQDPQTALPAEHVDEVSIEDDLAVIRVRAEGHNFDFARLGDPKQWKNGMRAFAIGQPAGKRWGTTLEGGPISDISASWLEVDSVFIKNGHSGGALIDQDFLIIGLVKETDGTTAKALRIDRAVLVLSETFKLKVQLTNSEAVSLSGAPAASSERTNPKDGLNYVWIPPGTFRMGCSEQPKDEQCDKSDEFPTHAVTLSKGSWMGQTEVTQQAYQRVTGKSPSNFKGAQRPVEQVSWTEADAYCSAVDLRLPTEAEWEYAARAGTRSAWYGGGAIGDIAWLSVKSNAQTHDVKEKPANAWKLFDMLGNVWEWTADWYDGNYYKSSPLQDPKGPATGTSRVLRGGSWFSLPEVVRVSNRSRVVPADRGGNIGFRCAGELR